MAHAYDNFDDAYDDYEWWWETGQDGTADILAKRSLAIAAYNDNDDHLAIYQLISAIFSCWYSLVYFMGSNFMYYDTSPFVESIYWANKDTPSAEFTMDILINTMLVADSEQVKYFVGLVDAYRQSVWNKPFNASFYAALARGFE